MKKLLVANRGEIAIRVFRTAREMSIKTVAVYSEADRHALHPTFADEAVFIGDPEPSASYLSIDKILEAAKAAGADAIHPGYGFLSERAEFVEACAAAGIKFVGPSAAAMRRLGGKIDAKKLAVEAGVPVTPGFFEPGAELEALKQAADTIGYPVMLKASAGGGGRGMRIVRSSAEFESELRIASDEALKGFGDGAMLVEKLIEKPRHIEVQFLADTHGNVACLFERECSLQRRHQKLVEEAPSTALDESTWDRLQTAVTSLVLKAEYTGAGTAEFMYDDASGEVYFLEVNARLQVEHPVTEAITGLDLVRQQLLIADGLHMEAATAPRTSIHGHSIEVRVVAEDPAMGFLPSIGRILAWAEPKGPGIRVDTGFGPGGEVSRYYDSMLAKVIVHAKTRELAINKLESALLDFHVLGVKTNIPYVLEILRHPEFLSAQFDTGWLGREFGEWAPSEKVPNELNAIIAAAGATAGAGTGETKSLGVWDLSDSFRLAEA